MVKMPASRRAHGGFTYLALLFLVAVLGIASATVAESWATLARREKEQQLLFIGNQYREALRRYHDALPDAPHPYPEKLEDLLRDPRFPDTRRYLRQLYPDPLTGQPDWVLIRRAGRIVALHSRVDAAPIKQEGFAPRDEEFRAAASYRQWVFDPSANAAGPTTNGSGGAHDPNGPTPSSRPSIQS